MIALELVHKIRKHKGCNGLILLKLDIKKAYGLLEWAFVDKALLSWGFSYNFKQLIFSCISLVKFDILINGRIVGNFVP